MKILRSADYKTMPWKNGGGVTVEIAVYPQDASVSAFNWRISMATVAEDGPFSIFPGIDRTLSIVEGNGMTLEIAGNDPVPLTIASDPLPFPADVPVDAHLTNGSIVDLNIMTRRASFRHTVQRLTGAHRIDLSGNTTALLALGTLKISTPQGSASLHRFDSLFVESGGSLTADPAKDDEVFFLITFDAV